MISDKDKIKYLFETTDKSIINCFGKFVFDSFEKHRKHRILEFDMECHALHGFGASALLVGETSGRFGGLHGLELLVGFGVANLVVPGSSWGWGRMGVML